MIVVVMRGGLGNQMFQYAAGRALAERNGVLLLLDTTLMRDRLPRKQITRYNLDLDIFGVKPSLTSLAKVANELPVPGVWLALDFALVGAYAVTGARKLLRESDYAAGREKFLAARTATLWGYWQSEKYFEDVKTEIREEFHFVQPLTGKPRESRRIFEIRIPFLSTCAAVTTRFQNTQRSMAGPISRTMSVRWRMWRKK